MSKSLKDQLEGVMQDSPPVEPDLEVEPDNADPDKNGKGGDDDKGKGRDLDNVRGELLRKQEKLEHTLRAEISALVGEVKGLTKALSATTVRQQSTKDDSLDSYTVSQLEGMRKDVPEASRAQFDSYIIDRKVREALSTQVGAYTEAQRMQNKRDQFNRTATARYPDLLDLTSEFAREVNARLQEQDDSIVENNPRIVLDIANDVAIEKNVKPHARRVVRGKPARTDTEPVVHEKTKSTVSDEDEAKIARKLAGALPKGKTFDKDRIKKRRQFYEGEELDLRINKG